MRERRGGREERREKEAEARHSLTRVLLHRALQEEYNQETNALRSGQGWAPPQSTDYRDAGYQEAPQQQQHGGGGAQPPPTSGAYCPVACSTCRTINHVPYHPGWVSFRCTNCAFHNRADLRIRARGERDWFEPGFMPIICNIM